MNDTEKCTGTTCYECLTYPSSSDCRWRVADQSCFDFYENPVYHTEGELISFSYKCSSSPGFVDSPTPRPTERPFAYYADSNIVDCTTATSCYSCVESSLSGDNCLWSESYGHCYDNRNTSYYSSGTRYCSAYDYDDYSSHVAAAFSILGWIIVASVACCCIFWASVTYFCCIRRPKQPVPVYQQQLMNQQQHVPQAQYQPMQPMQQQVQQTHQMQPVQNIQPSAPAYQPMQVATHVPQQQYQQQYPTLQ